MSFSIEPTDWMTAPATRAVTAALRTAGAEVRFVGGCVRDAVLGFSVGDIDLATTAQPEAVMNALKAANIKSVPTGIEHGTITAVCDGKSFEITTLRQDIETDGRHAVVTFSEDWRADAARRDFTMNAMSMDADGTIHDYFDGFDDARAGRVVFVGEAGQRIREDVLRMLRFYRFYAWYGVPPVDTEARMACRELAPLLPNLSGERVRKELLRLLQAPDPSSAIGMMRSDDIFPHVLPEAGSLSTLRRLIRLETNLGAVRPPLIKADAIRRLAAFVPGGPAAAASIANRLKLSTAERKRLVALLDRTQVPTEPGQVPATLYETGPSLTLDRLLLHWAKRNPPADTDSFLEPIEKWEKPRFPLTGADVLAAGAQPGPAVGQALSAVERWWIARSFEPDRAQCLKRLAGIISST